MNVYNVKKGQIYKNYKEMCSHLKSGSSKIAQLNEWSRHFEWKYIGYKWLITKVYKKPRKSKSKSIAHGLSGTRIYKIYTGMKYRCEKESCPAYPDYGGRGIQICSEWKDDFMCFYNWSMENDYDDNLSIDRINVNGNYEPDNCRWVTMKTQARNKRNTIHLPNKEFMTKAELIDYLVYIENKLEENDLSYIVKDYTDMQN